VKTTLFISDLHLSQSRPGITRLFFDFLRSTASEAQALYVLGDLFEYWAGDDDLAEPLHAEVASALRRLHAAGVAVYFMHGNRDFLAGAEFARATHAVLLSDPTLIDLYGTPTLLMHGDSLCIDDSAYMAFRDTVRSPAWQRAFLVQPLAERKAIIEGLRRESEEEKAQKNVAIMDVNLEAVATVLREHGYPRLIHGHTHRPARHLHEVDGKTCERWVLADWYEDGGYLRCDAAGCEAVALIASRRRS
jgi:UDP-2,3-diacylglucosamine hydrolase